MRPFGMYETEMLRLARERARKPARDWWMADAGRSGRGGTVRWQGAAFLHTVRRTAGRGLIALGRRVVPGEIEPCS